MKIYTKTGDKGKTGLIGGTRVSKNDVRIEAYGTVDELNSFIGMLTTFEMEPENMDFLKYIQNKLFTIGSYLATDTSKVALQKASVLDDDSISRIESQIDRLQASLPELKYFVLPGGSRVGALCHVCRTVTRRVERRLFDVTALFEVDNQILVFVNRLSDYFFVLSRYLTVNSGCEEIYWKTHE